MSEHVAGYRLVATDPDDARVSALTGWVASLGLPPPVRADHVEFDTVVEDVNGRPCAIGSRRVAVSVSNCPRPSPARLDLARRIVRDLLENDDQQGDPHE